MTTTTPDGDTLRWYAIRARRDTLLASLLADEDIETYRPTETVRRPDGTPHTHSVMPHIIFARTTRAHALDIERRGKVPGDRLPPMWIYRYTHDGDIQPIDDDRIALIRLLTAGDDTRCEIYNRQDFHTGQRVRITAGHFAGYEGNVCRVRRNKHVVVRIEGICAILLPYIHPSLLTPLA